MGVNLVDISLSAVVDNLFMHPYSQCFPQWDYMVYIGLGFIINYWLIHVSTMNC